MDDGRASVDLAAERDVKGGRRGAWGRRQEDQSKRLGRTCRGSGLARAKDSAGDRAAALTLAGAFT